MESFWSIMWLLLNILFFTCLCVPVPSLHWCIIGSWWWLWEFVKTPTNTTNESILLSVSGWYYFLERFISFHNSSALPGDYCAAVKSVNETQVSQIGSAFSCGFLPSNPPTGGGHKTRIGPFAGGDEGRPEKRRPENVTAAAHYK